ncbi:hypothetical protein [Peloplasma aerotolerans]|uniref:Peptidase M10 metallopeptidase domain-containing protein n=1 Tax=Peloplasma aerotolerans TaxID=3044389 RepID=A0AAW6UEX2_9MOLU|nr:hypothetical protein [Mariniplasma sp. M4Ah]MDI6453568.1 hypothetical protein [Mariniplasma sp. M4Ah]
MLTQQGQMKTNANPNAIQYYIANLPYKYRTAMQKAATVYSSNELESYITITTSMTNSNSTYKAELFVPPPPAPPGSCDNPLGCDTVVINIMTGDGTEAIAINHLKYDLNDNSKIVGSTVYFDDMIMIDFFQVQKNYIAIHELGHTLGLKDLFDDDDVSYQNKSVMYGKGEYSINVLYKFDIANILWHYKYGYIG